MKVWQKIKKALVPKGRRCVKHMWVFDIKRNGVFRAQLVACGYSQVPGVDFTEAFSPVVHDVSFHLMIIMQMIFKHKAMIMDVEVAFLNGDLDEEIYMECPKRMENEEGECLILLKALYSLVQAAWQFFLKFCDIMKKIGFQQNPVDPCMMMKGEKDDLPVVVVHVDDCYIIGNDDSLKDLVENIKGHGLSVKVEHKTKDYLGCEILFDKDKKVLAWSTVHCQENVESVQRSD
jgi:Reverse transcriptase (RNA-dependent DNA polymerase)